MVFFSVIFYSIIKTNGLMINEVNTHLEAGFIELINEDANEDGNVNEDRINLDGYGILVADLSEQEINTNRISWTKHPLRIRLIISLSGAVLKGKYGLIHNGQMSLESLVPRSPNIDYWRYIGRGFPTPNHWLKIQPGSFTGIFLFKDDDGIHGSHVHRTNQKKIEGQILEFLKSKVHDYVVIRDGKGPSKCLKVDDIVSEKLHTSDIRKMYGSNTKEYLKQLYDFPTEYSQGVNPSSEFSISKCGPIKAFDIRLFKNTKSTPLQDNDCDGEKYVAKDFSEQHTNIYQQASSSKADACGASPEEGATDLSTLHSEIEESISAVDETCPSEEVSNQRFGEIDVALKRRLNEQRRLRASDAFDDQEWSTVDPQFSTEIDFINKKLKHQLPIALIMKNKHWYKLEANEINPELSKHSCKLCSQNVDKLGWANRSKPKLSKKVQIKATRQENRDAIKHHSYSNSHQQIIEDLKIAKLSNPQKDVQELLKIMYEDNSMFSVTDTVITAAYYTAKLRWSLTGFVAVVKLLQLKKVPVGEHCATQWIGRQMINTISQNMHSSLKQHLLANNQPFSIISDSTTDITQKSQFEVLIMTYEDELPITYHYK